MKTCCISNDSYFCVFNIQLVRRHYLGLRGNERLLVVFFQDKEYTDSCVRHGPVIFQMIVNSQTFLRQLFQPNKINYKNKFIFYK